MPPKLRALYIVAWISAAAGLFAIITTYAKSDNTPAPVFPIVIQEVRTDDGIIHTPLNAENSITSGSETTPSWEAIAQPIRISSHNRKVDFIFSPQSLSKHSPIRFQFQLEGFEKEWHESCGPMRLVAHCQDNQGSPIDSGEFTAYGNSPGWTGNPETSPFIEQKFLVTVPLRAVELRLWMCSGGSRNVTGILIIDDVKVTLIGTNATDFGKTLLFCDFEQGIDLQQTSGKFINWIRSGTSLGIAQVVTVDRNQGNHAMGVIDTSPEQDGVWQSDGANTVPVNAGWKLLIQFKEMHSVGGVDRVRASYEDLPIGKYRFRIREVTELGIPRGLEAILPVAIVPPFYQTSWFRSMLLLIMGGFVAGAFRYRAIRRLKLQLQFERSREQERARIARDIHDDLGTGLTRISFLSEAAKSNWSTSKTDSNTLNQIHMTAQEMTRALDEIIWAVDPGEDSLESLTNHLVSMAQDILGAANIRFRLKLPFPGVKCMLPSEVRHHVSLACKEALNNIVKHAQATEARVELVLNNHNFVITLEDNGKGVDSDKKFQVNGLPSSRTSRGLANIQLRLKTVGGQMEVQSIPGKGTTVILTTPVVN